MEENCKPHSRFAFKRKKHFRRRPFSEQNIDQLFFGRRDFIWRSLVRSQIPNQLQDNGHVFQSRWTNLEIFRRFHFAS